jgi:DNA-directed RNA polymerase subunit H
MATDISESVLRKQIEPHHDKIFALFKLSDGRLSFEEKKSDKTERTGKTERRVYLEIKVFNDEAKLAGIVWYFGNKRAYIDDVRIMVNRKESQKVDMVLVAGESTTSAGKKELKEAKIRLIREVESIKSKTTKKKKTTVVEEEEEDISVDDDITLLGFNSELIQKAQELIKQQEPEIINVTEVKGFEGVSDVKGFSSAKDLLVVYRVVDKKSIGVKEVRTFAEHYTNKDTVPKHLLAPDKFTPTAKKEALDSKINIISLKDEITSEGNEETQALNERLRDGAIEIIQHRGYSLVSATDKRYTNLMAGSEKLGSYLIAEKTEKTKDGKSAKSKMLVLLPAEEVVRVATVRAFYDQMESLKFDKGMLIPLKRFTYTADRECKTLGITAYRKNNPVFNIFDHIYVPEHQTVTREEVRRILQQYNCKLHQLPKIYEDDPAVVIIEARIGDVVKVFRDPEDLSKVAYRLVVRRPDVDSVSSPRSLSEGLAGVEEEA